MRKLLLGLFVAAIAVFTSGTLRAASANPPCPQIGFADGCDAIITLNSNGTASISITGQPAYDNVEDQLVGVINNSGSSISAITLTGSDIFGFDGDGAFAPAQIVRWVHQVPFGCPFNIRGDPGDYSGPLTTFSITDASNGTVNFSGGLANGATAYFSLEEPPATGGFQVTGVTPGNGGPAPGPAPEPSSLMLLGSGVIGMAGFLRRRFLA
jgi:hypothetical protein